jgi:carboxymethylenebutenolidase
LLVQVGLLDPATLPVLGVEQAHKLMDRDRPSNELIERRQPETDDT